MCVDAFANVEPRETQDEINCFEISFSLLTPLSSPQLHFTVSGSKLHLNFSHNFPTAAETDWASQQGTTDYYWPRRQCDLPT